jgi:hypothetical protein
LGKEVAKPLFLAKYLAKELGSDCLYLLREGALIKAKTNVWVGACRRLQPGISK